MARRMQAKTSLRVPKNTFQESLEITITNIYRQISEETNHMIEDTTYKMPPHRHEDEYDSEDEVLVKQMTKIKQASKPICNTPSPRVRSVSDFLNSGAKWTEFHLKIDHFLGLKPYIRPSVMNRNIKEYQNKLNSYMWESKLYNPHARGAPSMKFNKIRK